MSGRDGVWSRMGRLRFLSPVHLPLAALCLLAFLHVTAILAFTRGFLLTRSALPHTNDCSPLSPEGVLDPSCSLPPRHSRAVILVVDALRADFVLPVTKDSSSPSYHNQLLLPAQTHARQPRRSFLSHFIADAPTTTLQRLKGLTTGSLPTFIDAGSNFAGERVDEDNWLWQAKRAGKRIAFVGDDTWLQVFPESHAENVWLANETTPMDSFNVEDLDTVDEAVSSRLSDLLSRPDDWDIVIAHALGLDHAGHRYGAAHDETRRKLHETDQLLQSIIDKLPNDALLVLMGDHGMTDRGDHGGDSREEVDAALWVYSNGPDLVDESWHRFALDDRRHPLHGIVAKAAGLSGQLLDTWAERGLATQRSVSQVDLVPTLSLLLGLPLPFGSLGQPIPELFFHRSSLPLPVGNQDSKKRSGLFRSAPAYESLSPLETLLHAYLLTASQVSAYVDAYVSSSSAGQDLRPFLPELHFNLALAQSAYKGVHAPGANKQAMQLQALERFWNYGRLVRSRARSIWARFDAMLILTGLVIWIGSLVIGVSLLSTTAQTRQVIGRSLQGAVLGSLLGVVVCFAGLTRQLPGHPCLHIAAVTALTTELAVVPITLRGVLPVLPPTKVAQAIPLLLHCAMFASNSFTVFEDRGVSILACAYFVATALWSFSSPDKQLRNRILVLSGLSLVSLRLMSISTICREEQMPNCHATFFKSSGSQATLYLALAATASAFFVPTMLRYVLTVSLSDQAFSPIFLGGIVRSLLLCGAGYWVIDWATSARPSEAAIVLVSLKTGLARVVLVGATLTAGLIWYYSPLSLRVRRETTKGPDGKDRTQVTFLGFANAFGSSYTLLFASVFALLFLVNPPPGQLVLVLQLVTILCMLELFDSMRDVEALTTAVSSTDGLQAFLRSDERTPTSKAIRGPTLLQLTVLSLVGHCGFFATGHQAVLSSIQWSTAFIGFPTVTYPFSPLLVVLNTLSSHILTTLAVPLFVLWNVPPRLSHEAPLPLIRPLVRTTATFLTIEATTSAMAALMAAYFRRHLMVWKVFAPRLMLGAITLLAVDATMVLLAVGWGTTQVMKKVKATLGTQFV